MRLGVATGLAVVGDLIGEGAAQERGVVGETPNLAARLQGLAAPNTLVIGEATRRQIGGLFDLEDLGRQALAGFAEPQHVWRVMGESGVVSRFEALRSAETPLVGREEEIEAASAPLGTGEERRRTGGADLGRAGHRQVTAHGGTFRADRNQSHTRLRYFCSPHHRTVRSIPLSRSSNAPPGSPVTTRSTPSSANAGPARAGHAR